MAKKDKPAAAQKPTKAVKQPASTQADSTPAKKSTSKRKQIPPVTGDVSTPNFLYVKVKPKATRKDLIEAVDSALQTRDLPAFDNRSRPKPGDVPAIEANAAPPASSEQPADGTGPGLGPGNALLMLIKQEGNP